MVVRQQDLFCQEFEQFFWKNGIKHTTSAPASNGLAERAVQVIKRGLMKVTDGTMSSRLAKVLLTCRVTPQSTTGLAPAEMLLGRSPCTRLDLLKPHTVERNLIQRRGLNRTARAKGDMIPLERLEL